jgi:nucleotide-binding universal stress UspA family protein
MDLKSVKRIVVGVDFTDLSRAALDTAISFARELGATLDLVHVAAEVAIATAPPVDVIALPLDPAKAVEEASRRLAIEETHARERGVTVEGTVLVGRPDVELVSRADATKADLIVLATHGRTGLSHALLGSLAERVVQHAHCPVLTVPHRPPKPL